MSTKEKNTTNSGFGVDHKPTVHTRHDRVSGHGDMKMSGTKEAYNKAVGDTKKA